jgi:hypothetical protein
MIRIGGWEKSICYRKLWMNVRRWRQRAKDTTMFDHNNNKNGDDNNKLSTELFFGWSQPKRGVYRYIAVWDIRFRLYFSRVVGIYFWSYFYYSRHAASLAALGFIYISGYIFNSFFFYTRPENDCSSRAHPRFPSVRLPVCASLCNDDGEPSPPGPIRRK